MIDTTTKMITTSTTWPSTWPTTTEMIDVINVHAGTLTTNLAVGAILYGMLI